nr:jouberin [Parasteatoda tepidariorum]
MNTNDNVDKSLTKITIHFCDNLKLGRLLTRPVVCMRVIDSSQGSLLKKQDKNKPAVSFYETQRGNIDYIMPLMTHPAAVDGDKLQLLKWEESFLLQESLEYLIKKESSTILFFEVMDCVPKSVTKDNYERLHDNGMRKIAWAFLKLLGSNEVINIGQRLRLQLYKPLPSQKRKKTSEIEVFQWWSKSTKSPLQASLLVSIEPHEIFSIEPSLRSMLPFQEETTISVSNKSIEKTNSSNNSIENSNESSNTAGNSIYKWSRKDGEPCKIPTTNSLSLATSGSCQILKFSSSGRFLIAGSGLSSQFFISVYEIPSGKFLTKKLAHSDVIYDIEWCSDDSCFISTSGDYSVKLWCSESWTFKASFVHPSYVYAAKFQPGTKNIICTACYDHIVRIWTYNNAVQLLQELEGHNGSVNTLCWIERKMKLLSGDSHGLINVWKIPNISKYSMNRNERKFEKYVHVKELNIPAIKITSVDKIIDGLSDVVHVFCGDGSVRSVDFIKDQVLFQYELPMKPQNPLSGCCSPCGNLLFLSSSNGSICVWNTKSKHIDATLPNNLHPCQLSCIEYHPYEHMFAVSSLEETICVHIYTFSNKTEEMSTNSTVLDSTKKATPKESKKSPKNKGAFCSLEASSEPSFEEKNRFLVWLCLNGFSFSLKVSGVILMYVRGASYLPYNS